MSLEHCRRCKIAKALLQWLLLLRLHIAERATRGPFNTAALLCIDHPHDQIEMFRRNDEARNVK